MIIHLGRLIAMSVVLTVLVGCNSGPHQQPAPNSVVTHDPKDGKEMPTKNSAPPEHGSSRGHRVGSSGPHQ